MPIVKNSDSIVKYSNTFKRLTLTRDKFRIKTIERKLTVEDERRAGVPEANIAFDPVEMPSDTELLQKITKEVVTELGDEILRPLQNLETTYFQETVLAAENFVYALFDEKLKRISRFSSYQKNCNRS